MNEIYDENSSQYKTPEEVKEIIQKYLNSNEILGYLNNDLLYMKSFGKDFSLDKIFTIIGVIMLLVLLEIDGLAENYGFVLLPVAIFFIILGVIFAKLLKFYLVYDIYREVFYTITNINNSTVYMTDEIRRSNIIELGVDVLDKVPGNDNQINSNIIYFKGDIMDNPGLRTSFIALLSNGKTVAISEPVALRQPHEAAVARCKMFSECFGLNSVICNKNEGLKIINENNTYKLTKFNREKDWAKAKKNNYLSLIITFSILIIVAFLVFFVIK